MDRESRRMLHFFASDYQGVLSRKSACRAYAERYGVSMPRVSACFDYLVEGDYLQPSGAINDGFFRIRHKGYHYRYFSFVAFAKEAVAGILVPLVVTALTLIVTALLSV